MYTADEAVIVLDGASADGSAALDGGWLAETLGTTIRRMLIARPADNLRELLFEAIALTRDQHGLRPGSAPSTTVSIVRWTGGCLDALVLGDSPIIIRKMNGEIAQVRDDRLARVAQRERHRVRSAQHESERSQARQELLSAEKAARNQVTGYWIAEANPQAAHHAITARWLLSSLDAVLVMTDGVSIGVDRYHVPASWADAFDLACQDPSLLLDAVQNAEEVDVSCTRWPRSKPHDDKAVALVRFWAAEQATATTDTR